MSDKNINREFCPRCAVKHLGQADILLKEARKGYPGHVWYALAHMAEAEDEIIDFMPAEANAIRDVRKVIEDSLNTGEWHKPSLLDLMQLVATVAMLPETIDETETP